MISAMVLENFKSYAGLQRVGPFHKVSYRACLFVQLVWQAFPSPKVMEIPKQYYWHSRGISLYLCGSKGQHFTSVLRCLLIVAVLLIGGWTKWQRQEQCHRRHAFCLWQTRKAGGNSEPECAMCGWVSICREDSLCSMSQYYGLVEPLAWVSPSLLPMQLRLNKVSELIHNSTNHQNLPDAKVHVHFHEIIDLVRTLAAVPYWNV